MRWTVAALVRRGVRWVENLIWTPGDSEEAAFSGLRLRGVRSTAFVALGSMAIRQLFMATPDSDYLAWLMRSILLLYLLYIVIFATERSAQRHGLMLTVMAKLGTTAKALGSMDGTVVFNTVCFGANRIVPVIAAMYGGPTFSIVMTVWSSIDVTAITLYKRALANRLEVDKLLNYSEWYTNDSELAALWTEINYMWVSTGLACAMIVYYRTALLQLAATLRERQRFIRDMNHEIRTPLVGVLGMTDLLVLQKDLPQHLATQLRVIHESGNALLTLINNLLDVSKLDAGMMRIELRPVSIRSVVERVTSTYRVLAISKSLKYSMAVDPVMPALNLSDETRLHQILGNLIANAFKFTKLGGVWVSAGFAKDGVDDVSTLFEVQEFEIKAEDSGIDRAWSLDRCASPPSEGAQGMATFCTTDAAEDEVLLTGSPSGHTPPHGSAGINTGRLKRQRRTSAVGQSTCWSLLGPTLWFKIIDTGIGMAEDELRRVIEPFQQADTSTARRFGGTGLGLSICRDLIHLLGGVFMYASAPGRGTIFLFAIPCTVLQQQDAGGAGGAPLLGPAPLRPATLAPPAAHVTERRSAPNTPRTSASPSDATRDAAPTAPAAPAAVTAVTSPTAPAPRQEASASSLRGRVVMVADDNPVNIQVVRRQLDELGCKCIAASNGEECVELVRQALLPGQSKAVPRPDVILMDINMPVMDGVQATAAIRAFEQELATADEGAGEGDGDGEGGGGGAPHKPVLIVGLSADDPAELQRSHESTLSLDTFLRKPVTLADLRQCLESLLAPLPAPEPGGAGH